MKKLKLVFVNLFLLSSLLGCQSVVEVPSFNAYITLPASGDGFGVNTTTKKEITIPRKEWDEQKKKGIVILSKDWKVLKKTVRKNCLNSRQCVEAVGALDALFYVIDNGFQQMQGR